MLHYGVLNVRGDAAQECVERMGRKLRYGVLNVGEECCTRVC